MFICEHVMKNSRNCQLEEEKFKNKCILVEHTYYFVLAVIQELWASSFFLKLGYLDMSLSHIFI
jgi:hypothetical protein